MEFETMDRATLGDWYAAQQGYNAADDESLSTEDLRQFCVQIQEMNDLVAAECKRLGVR